MNEIISWIRYSIAEGISKHSKIKLLKYFKNPTDIFNLSQLELFSFGIKSTKLLSEFKDEKYLNEAKLIYGRNIELDIKIMTYLDIDYPEYLKEIYDPPVILYYKGEIKGNDSCIGIVGSRKASESGKSIAKEFGEKLARAGFAIVSGMARGIDSKAHEGAIMACSRTYAIIGCGLDITYPPENKDLMKAIIKNGAVISEYPTKTIPSQYNFPMRNRIISGMSLGIVVVEASLKSGSLITASQALEQGRDVFAVPGNINNFISKGTNKLIKDGAKLVTKVDDILEEYKTYQNIDKELSSKKLNPIKNITSDERKIVDILKIETLNIDDISIKTGISFQNLSYLTLCLEMKGIISKDMGGEYFLKMD